MTQTILTFGDSNTHGTLPIEYEDQRRRLKPDARWPGVMQTALGCTLIEEGLPGRTTAYDDADMGVHMNGQLGLPIALESHGPIDIMTLMLGTNDVKACFGVTPQAIARNIAGLVDLCLSDEMQERHGGFKLLLICPPPVLEQGVIADKFIGGRVKSLALAPLYTAIAADRGIGFLDAGKVIESSPIDGIHYEAPAHALLGAAVAQALRRLQ